MVNDKREGEYWNHTLVLGEWCQIYFELVTCFEKWSQTARHRRQALTLFMTTAGARKYEGRLVKDDVRMSRKNILWRHTNGRVIWRGRISLVRWYSTRKVHTTSAIEEADPEVLWVYLLGSVYRLMNVREFIMLTVNMSNFKNGMDGRWVFTWANGADVYRRKLGKMVSALLEQ